MSRFRRFGRDLLVALAASPEASSRAAGRDVAKLLWNPDFRARLTAAGYRSGEGIVVVDPGETVGALLDTITDTRTPSLVAVPDPDQPHGFRLVSVTLPPAAESA